MRNLTIEELKQIAGGVAGEDNPSASKANNGWGNGAEGTNAGSDNGGTAPSKSAEADTTSETGPNNNINLDTR